MSRHRTPCDGVNAEDTAAILAAHARVDVRQAAHDRDEDVVPRTPTSRELLTCCEAGMTFIGLRHPGAVYYGFEDRQSYLAAVRATPPEWRLQAKPFIDRWEHAPPIEAPAVKVCPFCTVSMPPVRLKAHPVSLEIAVIIDGGYYCDTCAERLSNCECDLPEKLWEAVR